MHAESHAHCSDDVSVTQMRNADKNRDYQHPQAVPTLEEIPAGCPGQLQPCLPACCSAGEAPLRQLLLAWCCVH